MKYLTCLVDGMINAMQILIIAVGKDTPTSLRSLQQEYEKRLRPHAKVEWKILPASRSDSSDQARLQETATILSVIKPKDTIILLDERGQQQSNEAFAQTFERLAGVQGRIVFVIGGAFGVADELRTRAAFVWSFSKLVFPHQLIRVMLLEQLYRTYMVLQNHPYHHT